MSEPTRYLSLSGLADRIGVRVGTIQRYSRDGRLPAPDVLVGDGPRAVRGWSEATVDAWQEARPGRGARTDLHRASRT